MNECVIGTDDGAVWSYGVRVEDRSVIHNITEIAELCVIRYYATLPLFTFFFFLSSSFSPFFLADVVRYSATML